MRKRLFLVVGALALLFFAAGAPAVAQNVTFEATGITCGPAFFPRACVIDMSGDASTILYYNGVWTEADGFQPIGGPPGGVNLVGVSDDGSTIIGNVGLSDPPLGPRQEAAIWLGGSDWQPLGGLPNTSPCGFSYTSAFDVNGDGSKVVGLAWIGMNCQNSASAFEWTEETGMVQLGRVVPDRASRANRISDVGDVIAGWSDTSFGSRLAALFDDDGNPYWLEPDGSDLFVGEATGINSDGSVVVGGGFSNSLLPFSLFEAWRWTEATGVQSLGSVKGLRGDFIDGQHFSRDVSDDGGVVVGQSTLFNLGEQWAFIYREGEGMDMLQNFVRENTDAATAAVICDAERSPIAPPCTDWDFWNTSAVSDDGKTIVGTGRNPDGIFEAFIVRIED